MCRLVRRLYWDSQQWPYGEFYSRGRYQRLGHRWRGFCKTYGWVWSVRLAMMLAIMMWQNGQHLSLCHPSGVVPTPGLYILGTWRLYVANKREENTGREVKELFLHFYTTEECADRTTQKRLTPCHRLRMEGAFIFLPSLTASRSIPCPAPSPSSALLRQPCTMRRHTTLSLHIRYKFTLQRWVDDHSLNCSSLPQCGARN
jgi:hypothetical protein